MRRPLFLRAAACAVVLTFTLAGCSDDSPRAPIEIPSGGASVDPGEEKAVLDAFAAYWDEKVEIANSGKVPDDAFESTAVGVLREDEVTRAAKDAEQGLAREGEPEFKDQQVTVDGDSALVVACINEDDWAYVVDGERTTGDLGWTQLGREMRKVDDTWLVSNYSEDSTKDSCG